ncbi:hypothetical protein DY000_02017605 [Brassica cretica]|uniref:Uncharacterized protein n=1 Tax=Brassica cretica TaxID=69181 RepID=A0ABQ7CNP8_BRACR|nr:hypothetical protein DY000_02017605 [Brassica cretica]
MIVLLHIIGASLHAGFNSNEDLSPDSLYAASRPQILRLLTSTSIQAIETNLLAVLSSDEEIKICDAYKKNKGFVSCSGKAVVVHRLRVHRSVVAVRWLHLCLLLLSPRFPIEEHLKRREDRFRFSILEFVFISYFLAVLFFFAGSEYCGLVMLPSQPIVLDISFEEIIRASYSGDDIGISGIQDNKENLTFPSFIVDSRKPLLLRLPLSSSNRRPDVHHSTFESLRLGRSNQSIASGFLRFWDSLNFKKDREFVGITVLFLDEKSIASGFLRFWDSLNFKKDREFVGITVLFLDEKVNSVIHGFTPVGRANHYMSYLKADSIVKVDRFEVARCLSMNKITDHPFLIRFISLTIDEVITDAPEINLQSRLHCLTISK